MSSQTPLSRLIDIDPDVELQPELKDYEFGHYAFETLPKAKGKAVHEVITSSCGVNICEINITYNNSENSPYSVKLPLSNEKFSCLQDKDLKVRQLKQKVIPRDSMHNSTSLRKVFYTGPWLTMVIHLKQQWFLKI